MSGKTFQSAEVHAPMLLALLARHRSRSLSRRRILHSLPFTLAAVFVFSPAIDTFCFAESMSFDEAVKSMKAKNETLMASQDDINQRQAEQKAAKGLRGPKAELDFKYTFLDDPVKVSLGPLELEVQKKSYAKGKVTVTQPIYAGGRIRAANRAASAGTAEAVAQKAVTENQLVAELARRYYGLCLARCNEEVQAQKLDTMKKHTSRAKRLMDEGIVARVEYLNADVAQANAETDLAAAKRDISIISEGLSNILVSPEPVDPTSSLFMAAALEPCETFQSYVDANHPILKVLAAKHDMAHQGVKVEEADRKPTVYAFGIHELVTSDLTMMDPKWAVGVGVQYTLFDGFRAKNKATAARSVETKVQHLTQKAARDLKSLVLKRYQEMEKAREQFESYDRTLELAKENLRVRAHAFEEGMATSLEVIDATLSLSRAQLGRLKAAFDFDDAMFQLLEASGQTGSYAEYLANTTGVGEG